MQERTDGVRAQQVPIRPDAAVTEREKAAVLAKLLQHCGAESLDRLAVLTGWGLEVTLHALLQLVMDNQVKVASMRGVIRYALRNDAPAR